jgi:transcriptional regulator with XRE-family HTH domain
MFGERIAQERTRLGLSQQEVATFLGVSRAGVGMLELEKSALYASRLTQLGNLGFDVMFILTGEPSALAAGRLTDWSVVVDAFERLAAWELKRGVRIPADHKAAALKNLYLRQAKGVSGRDASIDEVMKRLVA